MKLQLLAVSAVALLRNASAAAPSLGAAMEDLVENLGPRLEENLSKKNPRAWRARTFKKCMKKCKMTPDECKQKCKKAEEPAEKAVKKSPLADIMEDLVENVVSRIDEEPAATVAASRRRDSRRRDNRRRRDSSRRRDSNRRTSRRNNRRRSSRRRSIDRRPNGNKCYNNSGRQVSCKKQDSADRRRRTRSSDRKQKSGSRNPSKSRRSDESKSDCERRCGHAGRSPARCRQKCRMPVAEIVALYRATGAFTALPAEDTEEAWEELLAHSEDSVDEEEEDSEDSVDEEEN